MISNMLNVRDLVKVSDTLFSMTGSDIEKCANPEQIRKRFSEMDFVLTDKEGGTRLPENVNASNLLEVITKFDGIQLPYEIPGTDITFLNMGVAWLQFLNRIGVTHHLQRGHHLVAA